MSYWSKVVKERRFGYALNKISNALVITVFVFAVFMVSLRLFGFNIYTVMSGSMEPSYPVGALIYTKSVDPKSLKEGDVITFMNDEKTIVTHRINSIITETTSSGETILRFKTKGDANNTPDGKLVHEKNILGTPALTLPLLGYLAFYLQRPPGLYIALIIGTFLISLIIIPSAMNKKGKEKLKSKSEI